VNGLSKLKTYLGLAKDNKDFDDILQMIINNTEMQLIFKLGLPVSEPVPLELAYIPIQVEVKRFNRLKNEGMSSFTQEGESITFNANDFDEFQDDINAWKTQHNATVLKAIDPYSRRGGQL
jgi:hypothetical protein